MPDQKYKAAYARLPEVEAQLAAAEQKAADLWVELKLARQYCSKAYMLEGHYLRVTAKYFSPNQPERQS